MSYMADIETVKLRCPSAQERHNLFFDTEPISVSHVQGLAIIGRLNRIKHTEKLKKIEEGMHEDRTEKSSSGYAVF